MFSEVTEVRDAIYLLTSRAQTRKSLRSWCGKWTGMTVTWPREADRSANTTPGNKKGGLSNIVEKSLGSIVKSGSSAITGVLGPGERFKKRA
jgi:galactarate dehydratase